MALGLIELAERSVDGVDLRLLWHGDGGEVVLQVADGKTGETFELQIPPARALDAFRRPYAYVSSSDARVVAPDAPGAAGSAARVRRTA